MTKNQIAAILTKYATVTNPNKTKLFIPADSIDKLAGEIVALNKSKVSPSLEEMIEFAKLKGYTEECAKKAWEHYEYANPPWTDTGGKPVRSWKQKLNTVWFRPEHKAVEKKEINKNMEGMVM